MNRASWHSGELGLALAVAAVAVCAFAPAVLCGFVTLDDGPYVADNPRVLAGLSAAGLDYALRSVVVSNWAPLTILSYQLDATLFGPGPRGFHVTNVALHAAAAALLTIALARMTGRTAAAAAVGLLWAVHPLRVESVVWIAERKDVLSAFFLALALVVYERHARRPSAPMMAAVAAVLGAGLLAKASLVTLPVLLLILDAWPLGRVAWPVTAVARPDDPARYPRLPWWRLVAEKWPLFALCGVFIVITLASQTRALAPSDRLPLVAARLPNALHGLCWYVVKTFLPTGLCPMRLHRGATFSAAYLAGCTMGIALAVTMAWRLRRSWPFVAAGLGWYVVALAPMIGIIQVGMQGTADRYAYIPQIGILVAVIWAAADVARVRGLRRPVAITVAAAVGACVVIDLRQIGVWRDGEALWSQVVMVEPDNYLAHDGLGNLWHVRRNFERARDHYLAALRHSGERPRFIANLAWLHYDVGDLERAHAYRDWALRVGPRDPDVRRMVEHVARPLP